MAAKPKIAARRQQLTLPLSREEKFARLRSAQFPTLSQRETRNVRQLLEKIESHAHRGNVFAIRTLCEMMDCSETTLRNTIKICVVLGILTVERRTAKDGGPAPSAYLVQWDQLRRSSPGSKDEPPGSKDEPPGSKDEPPGSKDEPPGSKDEPPGSKDEPPPTLQRRTTLPPNANHPPSKGAPGILDISARAFPPNLPFFVPSTTTQRCDSSDAAKPCDSSTEWAEVAAGLLELGLADWRTAIGQARSNGMSPLDVQDIIAVFRAFPKAWGLGALHWRIRSATPGQDAKAGWPAISKEFAAEQDRQARERRSEQARQTAAEHNAAAERSRQEQATLETAWGPRLDSLSEYALAELAERAFVLPDGRRNQLLFDKLRTDGRTSPLVRHFLLETLSQSPTQKGTPL